MKLVPLCARARCINPAAQASQLDGCDASPARTQRFPQMSRITVVSGTQPALPVNKSLSSLATSNTSLHLMHHPQSAKEQCTAGSSDVPASPASAPRGNVTRARSSLASSDTSCSKLRLESIHRAAGSTVTAGMTGGSINFSGRGGGQPACDAGVFSRSRLLALGLTKLSPALPRFQVFAVW